MTTLTKKMAEDLTDFLTEQGIKVKYMHHEVDTFERMEIIKDLRLGSIDVVVGINLLREGLDLPEVSLVAILDADKEGFLRSETSLIQTIGRAARNAEGLVIMYADEVTDSMDVPSQRPSAAAPSRWPTMKSTASYLRPSSRPLRTALRSAIRRRTQSGIPAAWQTGAGSCHRAPDPGDEGGCQAAGI